MTSSPHRPPANRSQSKGNVSEPTTNATVSRPSSKRSPSSGLDSLPSKTSPACSVVPGDPDPGEEPTSTTFCVTYDSGGTTSNGSPSAQDTLPPPGLANGYFWLARPSAMSSSGNGRPPGQTKLEQQLKDLGILHKGESVNPEWLEKHFDIPIGWTDPSELRTAAELIADAEKQLEIPWTGESQRSPYRELFTSTTSAPGLKKVSPKKPATGTLYKWLDKRNGKEYPAISGERDPDDPAHWNWTYCYSVKDGDKWRTKKRSVKRSLVPEVRKAIAAHQSVSEILKLIGG